MQETILVAFGLSAVAPWLYRMFRGGTGWLLGLMAAGLVALLARDLPTIAAGEIVRTSLPWFPGLNVHLSFYMDGLSLTFGLLIAGIGAIILVYTGGYLRGHRQLGRVYAYLIAFLASMLGVVFADNVLTLFVFWELTSLTSYFLIGINHEEERARSAALQALLVTGGGGLALLAGFICLGLVSGTFELSQMGSQRDAIIEHAMYVPVLLLILLGAFTKSAQFPFHFWLPNAMEAPTPVSAYLHSATMVKAGVYLLARLSPLLGDTTAWSVLVCGFGAVTFLAGAALAIGQNDLKRILAYTTVSILGGLTLLIGIGTSLSLIAAMVLLVAHALYKAALFLVAGAVDHSAGTRDIRRLAGLGRVMPITAAAAFVAACSNAGIPPTFGYLAKEGMYESLETGSGLVIALTLLAVVTNALLIATAAMVGWKPFVGRALGSPPAPPPADGHQDHDTETPHAHQPHEAPVSLWIGPVLLAAGTVGLGVWPGLVEPILAGAVQAIHGEPVEFHLAMWHGLNVALGLSVVTLIAGIWIYLRREQLLARLDRLGALARWGPDRGYAVGLEWLNLVARWQTRFLQSGYLRFYLMTIIMTAVVLGGIALARDADSISLIDPAPVMLYELVPSALIVLATLMAVTVGSRLAAVAALGALGYNVAVIFVLYGAPDLAMTQFAVETLTVILFVLVLYRLPRFMRYSKPLVRLRDVLVAGAGGALVTLLLLAVTAEPLESRLSEYFAEHSLPLAKGRNIVNVILVDFRALDTLGELSVLAIAAIGIRAFMKFTPRKDDAS